MFLLYDSICFLPVDNRINPGHANLSKRFPGLCMKIKFDEELLNEVCKLQTEREKIVNYPNHTSKKQLTLYIQ